MGLVFTGPCRLPTEAIAPSQRTERPSRVSAGIDGTVGGHVPMAGKASSFEERPLWVCLFFEDSPFLWCSRETKRKTLFWGGPKNRHVFGETSFGDVKEGMYGALKGGPAWCGKQSQAPFKRSKR